VVTNKRRIAAWAVWIATGAAVAGCSSRTLVIHKDRIINTANPLDSKKAPADRSGETLKVTVVSLAEEDIAKGGANQKLAPATFSMTSREFYEQEGSFTVSKKEFEVKGAKHDGKDTVTERIEFPGKLFKGTSVIYVFAKFKGPHGEVLPVKPVVYHPPGAFTSTLRVHIGANDSLDGDTCGQYIENESKRYFGKE